MIFPARVIENGIAERFMVSISDRKRNARLCADRAVAGRVDEIVRFNMKLPLAALLHAAQCRDAPPVQLHLVDLRVEQERQIFLAQHRAQNRSVRHQRGLYAVLRRRLIRTRRSVSTAAPSARPPQMWSRCSPVWSCWPNISVRPITCYVSHDNARTNVRQ